MSFSSSQVRSALQPSVWLIPSGRLRVSVPLRFDQHFNPVPPIQVLWGKEVSVPLRFDQHFNCCAFSSLHLAQTVSVPLRFDQHFNAGRVLMAIAGCCVSVPLRFDQHFNKFVAWARRPGYSCFSSSQVRSALQPPAQGATVEDSNDVSVPLRFDQHFNSFRVGSRWPKCEFQFLSGSISTSTRRYICANCSRLFVSVPLRFDQHFNQLQHAIRAGWGDKVSVPLRFDQHFNPPNP